MDASVQFSDNIANLYDAALDNTLWPKAMENICAQMGCRGMGIMVLDSQRMSFAFAVTVGLPQDFLTEYAERMVYHDPRVHYILAHPEVKLLYDYLHTAESEFDRHPYYDWHIKSSGIRYRLGAKLDQRNGQILLATLQFTPGQGHPDRDCMERYRQFVPHLERAVQISQRFAHLQMQTSASVELIHRLPYGVVLLGVDGQVLFLNDTAERIVANGDAFTLLGGHLCALRDCDDRLLQRLIGEAAGMAVSLSAGGCLSVPRRTGKRAYCLTVSPLPQEAIAFAQERTAAVVIITDPDQQQDLPEEALRRFYGLTPTEASLACRLATGLSVKEAAEQMGIALKTARLHLEHIFAKTHIHRQGELVRLVLSSTCNPKI